MEAFQTFEHNGRVLQLMAYEPGPSKPAKASTRPTPGAGKIEIESLDLLDGFTLTARVSGKNISYIYTEILLKDGGLDRFCGPVAREHVRADRDKEIREIRHPDWDETVDLAVGICPDLHLLTDGVDSAFCFAVPEGYGISDYRLGGLYTPAAGAAPARALFRFDRAGETKGLLVYKDQGRRSIPHVLTLKKGDQFAPFVQVLTPPTDRGGWYVSTALSTPLTVRSQALHVATETAMPGEYLVGLLVEDLDGKLTRRYVPLTVGE